MAYPEDPLDLRGELLLGGTWVDITSRMYTREPVRIVHGTAPGASQADPASCSVLLNNDGGALSPRNPMGPYYGLLGRNTPIRLTLPADESWLRLDGGYTSTPHSTGLTIPGDFDVRVEATLDDWRRTDRGIVLAGKWSFPLGRYCWRLIVNTYGGLSLSWSSTGTAAGALAADMLTSVPVPVDGRLCVRAVLDVNNGAGGWTATFYTAPVMAGPWTQLGTAVTGAGVTSVGAADVPLTVGMVGSSTSGAFVPVSGRVHRVEVRSGIGGTLLAAPDFTTLVHGASGTTDSAGRVWSLVGAAVIERREGLFAGEVSSWPPRWTGAGYDAWVPIQAAGILRRLGQGRRPLESPIRRRLMGAASLMAYWPMEEGADAQQIYSPLLGVRPLATSGLQLAADDSLPGSAPLPTLGASASISGSIPGSTTPGWQVEMVYRLPAVPSLQAEVLRVGVTGSTMRSAHVYASSAGIRVEGRDGDGAIVGFFVVTAPAAVADFAGRWNRLTLFVTDAGSGQTYLTAAWRDLADGSWWGAATVYTGTMGIATSVTGTWGSSMQGMALGHLSAVAVPGAGISTPGSTLYSGADRGFVGETAITRTRRLAEEEPALRLSARHAPGATSEALGPQGRVQLLDLLAEVGETDGGILAERMDQLGLVYRARNTLYNQAPALTLDYAVGEVSAPLEPTDDDDGLTNDMTVTRAGGGSGRSVATTGPLSTASPETGGVGVYEQAITLSLGSDAQTEQIASWLVHLGTWDEARYPSVRVELHRHPGLIPAAMRLRPGHLVRIVNPPLYTGPGPLDLIVRQIQHEPTPRTWVLTLVCAPAGPYRVGVYDDPVRGRYDTGGSQLASTATPTSGTLSVAYTDGVRWITTASHPGHFPFDITVGGERMTVTAISAAVSPQIFSVIRSVNGVSKTHVVGAAVRLADPTVYAL
ncbi:hypothetical protein [Streptomyces sp. AM 2-1-1]|uniref:hypothetical protein n=1 Tax=Streptomyces sp. AM 2-1-1 TaxID=3028709 RepID=UPI0023B9AD7B|nr:hypothetical protein [Streptomyces sp. AM 2-1-1]WEH40804.1 hypothetical protein PZB77_15540 [Streptomyces sp. AM 2-1-1]